MTGCGSRGKVIIIRLQRANSDSTSATSPVARISLRSWPEQNPRPRAASTTTRILESAAIRSSVDCNSSMSALESALNCPGRFNVTVAIPSVVSTSSNSSACVVASGVMVPSKRDAVRDQAMLVCLTFEALTEVGMSNPNQGLGTFRNGFSLQVDDSVLGDDVHHVGAWCGDDVAGCQVQHDAAPALAALLVGRRQANEGLAVL